MSDPQQASSALIISNDTSIVDEIISHNTSNLSFNARKSVQEALSEPTLLENNSVVIFDIATTDNNVESAIDQAIKIKQTDPTQVLIIVGDKEPLNAILKSHIQPMVFRAFNKPISPNQLFLSFNSAQTLHQELVMKRAAGEDILVIGPQENKTSLDSIAEERKTNPLIYAAAGVAVIGIVAFLFLGGDEKVQQNQVIQTPQVIESVVNEEENTINSQLDELNQLAATALQAGRYISPKGNNALEYYDRALAIDPYDSVAYDGRKSVATALRSSYSNLMKQEKFNEALVTVNALTAIEPLNPDNEKLQSELQAAVEAVAEKENAAGAAKAAAERSALLAKIESSNSKAKASSARKTEQALVSQIKSSLSSGNLIPPQSNNAYGLLSSGLKENKISKNNAGVLIKQLSDQLLARANSTFSRGDLAETNKLMNLINRIDGRSSGLATLRSKVNARKIAIAQNKNQAEVNSALQAKRQAELEQSPANQGVIPAKVISRSAPRYPSSAQKRGIEGWVQLGFTVDTKGDPQNVIIIDAQPRGVFDDAAIKSIKKWAFSPAKDQASGRSVTSSQITTRVTFKLE